LCHLRRFFLHLACLPLRPPSFTTRRSSGLEELLALRLREHVRLDLREPLAVAGDRQPRVAVERPLPVLHVLRDVDDDRPRPTGADRKSTRLNSSHVKISYAVFCL